MMGARSMGQAGRVGVCLATLGPGATNPITGVADANSDGAPLVCITGQVSTDNIHLTAHQSLDLLICVGYDIVEYAPRRINPTGKTPLLHINTTPSHINKYGQTACAVVGERFAAPHHAAHPPHL